MTTMKRILLFEFNESYPHGGIGDWKEQHDTVDEAKATTPGDPRTTQMIVEMVEHHTALRPVPIATRHGDGNWLDGDHYDAFTTARKAG